MQNKRLILILTTLFIRLGFLFTDSTGYFAKNTKKYTTSKQNTNILSITSKTPEIKKIIKLDMNKNIEESKKDIENIKEEENLFFLDTNENPTISTNSEKTIASTFNIKGVSFYPQAPYADRGPPYQESCEEASLILGYNYISDRKQSRKQFNKEILAMVDWEVKYFGYYEDTNIQQVQVILNNFYGYTESKILIDPTIDDLKNEISNGHVIVAPFYGKALGNPHYNNGGADYHMMLIKGYDEENFIVHDVGTSRGNDRYYSYDTIMNALHDRHTEDIRLGTQKVLVLKK